MSDSTPDAAPVAPKAATKDTALASPPAGSAEECRAALGAVVTRLSNLQEGVTEDSADAARLRGRIDGALLQLRMIVEGR